MLWNRHPRGSSSSTTAGPLQSVTTLAGPCQPERQRGRRRVRRNSDLLSNHENNKNNVFESIPSRCYGFVIRTIVSSMSRRKKTTAMNDSSTTTTTTTTNESPQKEKGQHGNSNSIMPNNSNNNNKCNRGVWFVFRYCSVDGLFLFLVVLGMWKMVLVKQRHVNLDTIQNWHIRQLEHHHFHQGKSALFRGTRACNDLFQRGAETYSDIPLCHIHFPQDIMFVLDRPKKIQQHNPETTRNYYNTNPPQFIVRTYRGCESFIANRSMSSLAQDSTATTTTTCHRKKQNHAALLRPLSFDGGTIGSNNNNNNNVTGQMIVLATGLDEKGYKLAQEIIVHLPLLVLDPFRRYAKAHTKIKTKILGNAFQTMDRSLHQEHDTLWHDAAASALVLLQYGSSSIFLASVGNAVGFLACWNDRTQSAHILKRTVRHTLQFAKERNRILQAGGTVRQDSITGMPRIFRQQPLSKRNQVDDPGIDISRAIGAGQWKFVGVNSIPSIVEFHPQSIANKTLEQNNFNNHSQKSNHGQSSFCYDHNKLFLVAASPGVTRFLTDQRVADNIGKALFVSVDAATSISNEDKISSATGNNITLEDQVKIILKQAALEWAIHASKNPKEEESPPKQHGATLGKGQQEYPDEMTLVVSTVI